MLFNNRFDYMATPKALAQLEKTNVFVDSLKQRDNVQAVAWNNVTYEEHLGDGRYCSLFQVKVKIKRSSSKQRRSKSSRSGRKVDDDDESNCCLDDEKTKQYSRKMSKQYALKCLDVKMRPKEFVFAAMDLLYEAGLLASIDHEHIVRLRGVSADNLAESYRDTNRRGFFFLFNLVSMSLRDRLSSWKLAKQREEAQLTQSRFFRKSWQTTTTPSSSPSSSPEESRDRKNLPTVAQQVPSLEHRLRDVALPIAEGMQYLHKQNIVLRTLNPETGLGFYAKTGKIMICDLGLARPIQDVHDMVPSGMNPYYKAPEYFKRIGCGVKSDVYSFAMVLYELVTLKHPFEKYTKLDFEAFEKNVIMEGERPTFNNGVSPALKSLIRSCWDEVANHRPSFAEIVKQLEKIVASTEGDDCPMSPVVCESSETKGRRLLSGTMKDRLRSTSLHDKRTMKYQVKVKYELR